MRRTVFATLMAGLALAGCDDDVTYPTVEPELSYHAGPGSDVTRTYRVTVTNLTSSQPLTPPLVATHAFGTRLFRVGMSAPETVTEIERHRALFTARRRVGDRL